MRIFNINRGVRGSRTLQENALRFAYMITDVAKKRVAIIAFWKKHGAEAAGEAFAVKERTLFLWQQKLRENKGKLEALNNGSRAPKKKRKRRYDYRIVEEIQRLRDIHPNLGEKKIYPLLKEFCEVQNLSCPKPSTIGRIMKDKGGMRTIPQRITGTGRIRPYKKEKVLRKPKDIKAEHPENLVALDTIEFVLHGLRFYIITVEDIHGSLSHGLHVLMLQKRRKSSSVCGNRYFRTKRRLCSLTTVQSSRNTLVFDLRNCRLLTFTPIHDVPK